MAKLQRLAVAAPDAGPAPQGELESLREQVHQLRLLADNVPAAIAYFQREGFACRFANRGYCELFGRDPDGIVGLSFAQIIGAEAAAAIQPMVDRMLSDGVAAAYERELRGQDGAVRHIEVNLLPHVGAAGDTIGSFVLITDITRHRRAEAALRQSEERLAKFMHASAEGIVFHRQGLITDVNPPLLALIGYTLEEMRGRHTLEFIAPEQRDRVREVMIAGAEITYPSVAVHRDGTKIPVEFIVRTMRHQDEVLRMTIVRDLRDRLAAEERIRFLAHHDALTGLPNRYSFIERIESLIPQATARGEGFALVFIDLDHFKRVNDSLGHLVGDALLQTVASRITDNLRSTDLVARFGGDEFVVLLAADAPADAVHEVARKLLHVVGAPVQLGGTSISVTPSIGVAQFPQHGRTPDELIKHADTAMYDAKARGRAMVSFFEPAMAEAAVRALTIEGELARALDEQQFLLHFQPQRRLVDGSLAGVEALIRWRHPERGLIGPDHFLPVAEASRLMLRIGRWVLEEALRWAVRWRRAGLMDVPVAVNLSETEFQSPVFLEGVEQALGQARLHGAALEVEMTERMLMADLPAVRHTLERLKAMGVRIAVDDFGTGYTSLGHLRDLPVDRLKIDRTFVKDLPRDARAAAIAEAIIQLARSLGLQVVAEGVETAEQSDWLAERCCEVRQGYLDADPMPAPRFEDWLRQRHAG